MSSEPTSTDASAGAPARTPATAALLSAALAQLSEGVIVADALGRIQSVNEAAARLHGVARLDVGVDEYAAAYRLLTEDGRPYPSTELPLARAVLRGQTVVDARWRIRRPDGSEILALGSARPVLGPAGERLGAVLTLRDDTARADAARAERRAAEILERVADAHVAFHRELRYVAVNAAGERSMGRPREALLGKTLLEAFPSARGSESERQYRRVLAEGVEAHFAEHYVGDGLDNHVEVDAYPTEEGGVAVFWREVNAQVRAERALRESEARYRTLFESIDSGFCVIEVLFDREDRAVDYRFLETNPAFVQQTGLANAVGRTMRELAPAHEAHWFEIYGRIALTGVPERFEAPAEALGRWYDVYAFRIGAPADRRVAILFTDRSAAKAAERERDRLLVAERAARAEAEAARADAEAASRAKSEFLAVMSHELRTPLNAIGGYAELLEMGLRGPVTDAQREDLARIQRSQRHLLGLINEVLNYTRIETGAVSYAITNVPVAEAVTAAETLVAPQLRAKGLGYAYVGCDPALTVRADRDKLQQILLNLLSNAVKFTNARPGLAGRIEVSGEARGERVLIRVRDTGIGIPRDRLETIFEPFVQVNTALTRPHEGVGLGLAISRDLARGMGGDLTAESEEGVGSTFVVALPTSAR